MVRGSRGAALRRAAAQRPRGDSEFMLRHHFGDVVYDVEGFVAASRDAAPTDVQALLEASVAPFVAQARGAVGRRR